MPRELTFEANTHRLGPHLYYLKIFLLCMDTKALVRRFYFKLVCRAELGKKLFTSSRYHWFQQYSQPLIALGGHT